MVKVTIFTTDWCPYCDKAKALLTQLKIPFVNIDLSQNDELQDQIMQKSKMRTVPIIYFGDLLIGGYTDLKAIHDEGKIAAKLEEAAKCSTN